MKQIEAIPASPATTPVPRSGAPARDHFRRDARPGGEVAVRYALVSSGRRARPRAARTCNIGVGGAFIATRHPPAPGTVLSLAVEGLPGGAELSLRAEVRWVSEGRSAPARGMGVRFEGLSADERDRLADFLASLTEAVDHDELL